MKLILRVLLSVTLGACIALLTSMVVFAANYYISESQLTHITGPSNPPATISNSGCVGGQCRYLYQSASPSGYRWNYTQNNANLWHAYDPTIGEAAARYSVKVISYPEWYITMKQANVNNKGHYVYLGFSDLYPNNGGYLSLTNQCVSGYFCGGLRVFWDSMMYTRP